MSNKEWDKSLEQSLQDYQEQPSHDLWADIGASLMNSEEVNSEGVNSEEVNSATKARIVPLWVRRAIAASIALLLIGGGIALWHRHDGNDYYVQEVLNQLAEVGANASERLSSEQTGVATLGSVASLGANASERLSSEHTGIATLGSVASYNDDSTNATGLKDQNQLSDTNAAGLKGQNQLSDANAAGLKGQKQIAQGNALGNDAQINSRPERAKATSSHLALAVSLGGAPSYGNDERGVLMAPSMLSRFYYDGKDRHSPFLAGYTEKEHHSLPFTLGLTTSYRIASRLSLTTGIVYTQLNSEFSSSTPMQTTTTRQRLHYLGVPLGLQMSLWRTGHLSTYIAAVCQADFNIKSALHTDGVEQHIGHDRPQWSIGGSLGIGYELLPRTSLYAESGLRHYFDNGSTIDNYFKDKPTAITLQFGLRIEM